MSTTDNVSAEIEIKVSIKSNVPGLKKYLEDLFGAIKGAFVVPEIKISDVPVPDAKEKPSESKREKSVEKQDYSSSSLRRHLEPLARFRKKCTVCGKEYIPNNNRQKKCDDCRLPKIKRVVNTKVEKTVFTKTCEQCGTIFTTTVAGRKRCFNRTCLQSNPNSKPIEVETPVVSQSFEYKHKCISCGRIFYTKLPEVDRKLCNDNCKPI